MVEAMVFKWEYSLLVDSFHTELQQKIECCPRLSYLYHHYSCLMEEATYSYPLVLYLFFLPLKTNIWLSVVTHTYTSSIWEVETGVQDA